MSQVPASKRVSTSVLNGAYYRSGPAAIVADLASVARRRVLRSRALRRESVGDLGQWQTSPGRIDHVFTLIVGGVFIDPLFAKFANATARATGSPIASILCVAAVVIWAVSGPFFGFSETWQLVINTGTSIITFLMVFLIQNTQNRGWDCPSDQARRDRTLL